MQDIGFKTFLLNEDAAYLGQRVGDILNATQELADQGPSMGTRHQVKNAETIVNQIRRVLHSGWRKEDDPHLKVLQKVGVAIMRAIEEKDDLMGIVQSVNQELTKLAGEIGSPQHSLGAPEGADKSPDGKDDALAEPQGPDDKKKAPPQDQQQPPSEGPPMGPGAMPGQMPPPGGQPGQMPAPGPAAMPPPPPAPM